MPSVPQRIEPVFLEKVWGSHHLEPLFPNSEKRIGEVWFTADDLPLLVKFLFTSDRLSVQVHPGDDYAHRHHESKGKTEMWHILRADPGAQVALGFREELSPQQFRQAAESGEIVDLLCWIDAKPGDTFLVPAGTVHAIGAGLSLCEIQQRSDITYRIYDYGRPRELHLEDALNVSCCGPRHGVEPRRGDLLAACDYFQTEDMPVAGAVLYQPDPRRLHLLITLAGTGQIAGQKFGPGEVWRVPAGAQPFEIASEQARLLRTFVP